MLKEIELVLLKPKNEEDVTKEDIVQAYAKMIALLSDNEQKSLNT